jgi:hypothetical protein
MVPAYPKAEELTKAQMLSKALYGRQYFLDVVAQIARDHVGTDERHFSVTGLSEAGNRLTPQKVHLEVKCLVKSGLVKYVATAGRRFFEAVPSGFWAATLALIEDEVERLDVSL